MNVATDEQWSSKSGKDGAIKHLMSGVNPRGCQVFGFKHPNAGKLEHDFLWRTIRDLPERGRIGIFNRMTDRQNLADHDQRGEPHRQLRKEVVKRRGGWCSVTVEERRTR